MVQIVGSSMRRSCSSSPTFSSSSLLPSAGDSPSVAARNVSHEGQVKPSVTSVPVATRSVLQLHGAVSQKKPMPHA